MSFIISSSKLHTLSYRLEPLRLHQPSQDRDSPTMTDDGRSFADDRSFLAVLVLISGLVYMSVIKRGWGMEDGLQDDQNHQE